MDETDFLTARLNESTAELSLRFDPALLAEAGVRPDEVAVRALLEAQGYARCRINEQALQGFVRDCRDAQEVVEKVIGQRLDGEFKLTLAADLMTAWLTLHPPQGGRSVAAQVPDALREQGVVFGRQEEALKAALLAGRCEELVVACGLPPVEGQPVRFERLFAEEVQGLAEDDQARISLTAISRLLLVRVGDLLMRRHPPIPGRNGTNIRGELIPAKPLPDEGFAENLDGAAPAESDANLLVAIKPGQPMVVDRGVVINSVLNVEQVGLETGSIEFEGTLNVAGDIRAGLCVKVSGDVIVNGMVEAAEIHAGGNVSIKGGVIGRSEGARAGVRSLPENTARIHCAGEFSALFAEHAHVEAGSSIFIAREASHCELIAGKDIIIGKLGARGGVLLGGLSQATERFECTVLGTATGVPTWVQVGLDPYLDEVLLGKRRDAQKKTEELDQLLLLQRHLQLHPEKDRGGLGEKTENTRILLLTKLEELQAEVAALEAQQETVEQACIVVRKNLYFGSVLRIGRQVHQVNDDYGATVARLDENGDILLER